MTPTSFTKRKEWTDWLIFELDKSEHGPNKKLLLACAGNDLMI